VGVGVGGGWENLVRASAFTPRTSEPKSLKDYYLLVLELSQGEGKRRGKKKEPRGAGSF